MSTVPLGKNDKISYYEEHAPIFVANAAALGVDPAAAADLQTKTTSARGSFNTQQTAKTSARTAVGNCNIAVKAMSDAGADIIRQIRATAAVEGDSIYTLAGLPIPAAPSPVPPPGKPTDFAVVLLPNGSIELSWRCENSANAAGPLYHVYRREAAGVPWTFIAGTGEKKLLDTTLPAGVDRKS